MSRDEELRIRGEEDDRSAWGPWHEDRLQEEASWAAGILPFPFFLSHSPSKCKGYGSLWTHAS